MVVFQYLFKNNIRNKKRIIILLLAISITTSLISSIIISSDAVQENSLNQQKSSRYVDFSITSYEIESDNFTEAMKLINPIRSDHPEIADIYESLKIKFYQTCYNFNGDSINWTPYTDAFYDSSLFQETLIYGINPDSSLVESLEDNIQVESLKPFSEINPKKEIFIDSKTANQNNITLGQNITIGNYYNYYYYEGPQHVNPVSRTNSEKNMTVVGIFTITNYQPFDQIIYNTQDGEKEFTMILTSSNYGYDLFRALFNDTIHHMEWYSYEFYWKIGIVYDLSVMGTNLQSIKDKSTTLIREIIALNLSYNFQVNNHIQRLIDNIQNQGSFYLFYSTILTLPIIILGLYIVKSVYDMIFSNRKREIGLLFAHSLSKNQIKSIFIIESIILGAVGGILGSIIGGISSGYINSFLLDQNITFDFLLKSLQISNLIAGLIFGIIISVVIMYPTIKKYLKLRPIDSIENRSPQIKKTDTINKSDWAALIFAISSILFTSIFDSSVFGFGAQPIMTFFLAIMPVVPFLLIYEITKFFSYFSIEFYSKITSKISKIINKKLSFLISGDLNQNKSKNIKITSVVALSISILFISNILIASHDQYQNELGFIYFGRDANFLIEKDNPNENLSIYSQIQQLSASQNLNISNIITLEYKTIGLAWGNNNFDLVSMDFNNFTTEFNDLDRFIVSGSAETVFSLLISTNNSVIVPSNFITGYNFRVGDTIPIPQYNKELLIVGEYSSLPGIDPELNSNLHMAFVYHSSSISDIIPERYHLLVDYKGLNLENLDDLPSISNKNQIAFEFWDALSTNTEISLKFDYSVLNDDSISSVIDFYQIGKIYTIIFAIMGISVILFAMINENSVNIALLRTRGISKKDIFKIQLFKGSIFLIIGSVIGVSGILSAYTILNSMKYMLVTTVPRFLIIPWFSLIIEISIIIFIFIAVILISTYIVTKQSNVDRISTIFRSV